MERVPPTIDMLPDGSFRPAPGRPVVPLSAKMLLAAVIVAAVTVSIAIAALAIWVVSLLLPVIILASVTAWCLYRYRRWKFFRSQGGSQGGRLNPRQPGGFGP